MGVDVLVLVGSNKTADIEAIKAIYGAGAVIRPVRSADGLLAAIKSYTTIRRLVIGTHGSEGDVVIAGVHTSIRKLASSIRTSALPPRVTEAVVFDGCNIAGESESLLEFMDAVRAPLLQAFATSRLWWWDEYVIPRGTHDKALADLKRRYDFLKEYLVANQPSWDELVRRGGARLWYEGFSRTLRDRPRNDDEKRAVVPRSKLEIVRVTANDVGTLGSRTGRPGGPMILVEIRRARP